MAYWGTIKIFNSLYQITQNVIGFGVWSLWGPQESEELKLARENKIKLDNIEKQLTQMWAVQSGMAGCNIEPEEYQHMMKSMVLVEVEINKEKEDNNNNNFDEPDKKIQ